MTKTLTYVLRVFTAIFAVVAALGSLSAGDQRVTPKPEGTRLTASLLADTHTGEAFYRNIIFAPCVYDASIRVKPDVRVFAGDCTDNGNEDNWKAFKGVLDRWPYSGETIVALGNHDTWESYEGDHDYDSAKATYLKYAGAIMGMQLDEVWFTREIEGYPFIVMGQEDSSVSMTLGETQLAWVDAQLAKAAEKHPGKPVFVICHQPLNDTHAVGKNENSNGFGDDEMSGRLAAILDKYENVFFISGHQHYGLTLTPDARGFTTFEKVGEHVTSVNLPSAEYGDFVTGGKGVPGQGLMMYVTDNEVIFRGRNFFLGSPISGFEYTVELTR